MHVQLDRVVRSHGATIVLDEVTLAVGAGSRVGVVGPNGVGKSTLLRLLAGLEEPDGGRVVRAPAGARTSAYWRRSASGSQARRCATCSGERTGRRGRGA